MRRFQVGWKTEFVSDLLVVLVVLFCVPAYAHMPAMGAFDSVASAYEITDPDWSQVVYHDATCDAPRVWMKVQLTKGQKFFIQLGAPQRDELQSHQWMLAVLGPALPKVDVPFEVPGGAGGQVWEGDLPTTAKKFFEPFSQTDSWIVREMVWNAPVDGTYWLVAWEKNRYPSRLWLSVGTVEKFSGVNTGELMKTMVKTGLVKRPE